MVAYPDTRIKWHNLGLIPRTNMEFWHQYEAGASGTDTVFDYSGNARTITSGTTDPLLTSNVTYGQPAWYFDGAATDPLVWSGTLTLRHYFVLASAEGATFNLNRGLMSGATVGDVLASNNSGTTFFNLGFGGSFQYFKSNVAYAESNQQAPMNKFELVEVIAPAGITLDAIQVGKQRNIAGRIWKGWWAEHMGFNALLSAYDRRRVLTYYALRYGAHLPVGSQVPIYFPDYKTMLKDTNVVNNRYLKVPRAWEEVTESYEFEDANKVFNEFGDNPPRRWEYGYENVSKEQAQLFEVFNDTVRRAVPFSFKDPDGYLWSNVKIEEGGYKRGHDAHKRWKQTVLYNLVGYNSTGVYEGF